MTSKKRFAKVEEPQKHRDLIIVELEREWEWGLFQVHLPG